jgi:hypothetical protein
LIKRIRAAGIFVTLLSAVLCTPLAWGFPYDLGTRASVYEYVNDATGHYFLATEGDQQILEGGGAGPGWHRTGRGFRVYSLGGGSGQPVCRFYAPGANTHFFTANADECGALQAHPEWGWTFEGVKFRVAVPVDGGCAANDPQPVHRLYNNRFQLNDSNHRYVYDDALRADMVASGWSDEGVVFCSEFRLDTPVKTFLFVPSGDTVRPIADCENEDVTRGSCIGMNGLNAALTTQVDPCDANSTNCAKPGPFSSPSFGALTGLGGMLFTTQPAYATQAILEHSFVQTQSYGAGAHVSSVDAFGALASIEPLYQFPVRTPGAGAVDTRVFPWRLARENHIDLAFWLTPKTVRRANAQSHGYGAPMIEFRDVTSGAAIDVSMLTYATFPPGDFVGAIDSRTGNVYVSTSMGAKTLFGTTLEGGFIPCAGDGVCATAITHFYFRITAADFAKILVLARGANPALSANPADYALVNFRFRHGILGTADVGASVADMSLAIFGY